MEMPGHSGPRRPPSPRIMCSAPGVAQAYRRRHLARQEARQDLSQWVEVFRNRRHRHARLAMLTG
jgi:hypothetical protein